MQSVASRCPSHMKNAAGIFMRSLCGILHNQF
jgi:hypothetical protein